MSSSPTQFDVARACRVSRSTVAAVMQSRPSTSVVSQDTRKRVLEVARRMNYQPHFAGRSLRSGKTHNIAFAVPRASVFNATIPSQVLIGIMKRARELGYSLTVCAYDYDGGQETSFEDLVHASRFDGFFHFGQQNSEGDRRAQICAQWHKPYVVLQRPVDGATSIYFDDVLGGRLAARCLLNSGCKNIALVSQSKASYYAQRLQGALAEIKRRNAGAIVLPLHELDFAESGRQAVKTLAQNKQKVDGIYAATDQTAMGIIQELHCQGLSVPEDVQVVGHDDAPMAALSTPPLTTVRQDGKAMGELAMSVLHRHIEANGQPSSEEHKLAPELCIRESTINRPIKKNTSGHTSRGVAPFVKR